MGSGQLIKEEHDKHVQVKEWLKTVFITLFINKYLYVFWSTFCVLRRSRILDYYRALYTTRQRKRPTQNIT